ncbi:hypothetical protein [Embleya sp. NBC_00896]|uniref:hypothetical protein n=1 Tax=Embleya sp. NBC_00896 TaxID=2975961 RepID=UPI002F9076FC|nr:hypothetical protein OG928_36925 [Embleya sp. NBC_00896]
MIMTRPLILGRRSTAPVRSLPPLPDHHYDPVVGANVTAAGTLLIHVAEPAAIASYTGTQEQGGWKKDD